MTNNELLHASLLDILFDGRNKEYGAYDLRRGYNKRMLLALAAGLSLIIVFILFTLLKPGDKKLIGHVRVDEGTMIVKFVEMPEEKIAPPVIPTPPKQPSAAIKNTNYLFVDKLDHTEVPDIADLQGKITGTENVEGPTMPENTVQPPTAATGNGSTVIVAEKPAEPEVMLPSSAPEFPGGPEALKKFLGRNLETPESLELGQRKTVRARFRVDKDGTVSLVDIEASGGAAFDKEVIRVCKKMPKWKPAIQNGQPVTTSYVLPVTFISEEQ